MDVSQAYFAILIAGALGALCGSTLPIAGWVVTSALLMMTLVLSAVTGGLDLLGLVAAGVLAIIGFNAGLVVGLIPRAWIALGA